MNNECLTYSYRSYSLNIQAYIYTGILSFQNSGKLNQGCMDLFYIYPLNINLNLENFNLKKYIDMYAIIRVWHWYPVYPGRHSQLNPVRPSVACMFVHLPPFSQ